MCELKKFFCCLGIEIGGFFIGWLYFLIYLCGFIATFAVALVVLADGNYNPGILSPSSGVFVKLIWNLKIFIHF